LVRSLALTDRERISEAFAQGQTAAPSSILARAAVAAVFREGDAGSELLFIERATREGDPWSGHMALPGGRVEAADTDAYATAERETWEEIGLDLSVAERLGRLDDLHGGARQITVSAHGYWLAGGRPELALNHEVADALWVPLAELADPGRFILYQYPRNPVETFPGIIVHGDRVVWGLTLRLLKDLFARLRHPFAVGD
jgi:8-oxo-dGTP pyrophosphatase MutT (NUDIX family)